MRTINWYQYLKLPEAVRKRYIGVLTNKKNEAICYEEGEEKKYNTALKKAIKEKEKEDAELILSNLRGR